MMRIAFILFACLLGVGIGVGLVTTENTSTQNLEESGSAVVESPEGAATPRTANSEDKDEKNRWRKLRFWDIFEPTRKVRFETPELYLERYAARNVIDPKISVFEIKATPIAPKGVQLTGSVMWPEYKKGIESTFETLGFDPIESDLTVYPSETLEGQWFAFVTTHTLKIYREPREKSEQMDQAAFGDGVRLLDRSNDGEWVRVVATDGYIGWAMLGHLRPVESGEWKPYFSETRWARFLRPIRIEGEGKETIVIPASSSLPLLESPEAAAYTGSIEPIRVRGQETAPAVESQEKATVAVRLPFVAPDNVALVPASAVVEFRAPGDKMEKKIRAIAEPIIGVPYVWGGISELGVDCSGFTQYVNRILGFALSRDADEQSIAGRLVCWRGEGFDALLPGDLLFFINTSGRVSHVAMSLGGTDYVHASGGKVGYGSLNPDSPIFIEHYLRQFAYAKRNRLIELE